MGLQKLSDRLQWPSPQTRRCASLPAAHDPKKIELLRPAASNFAKSLLRRFSLRRQLS